MFIDLTSNTLSNSSIAFLLFGPGISVLTMGPEGSLGKNGCSPPGSETLAAAALANARELTQAGVLVAMRDATGPRRAAARRDAISFVFVV